jgi:hypothetical protein
LPLQIYHAKTYEKMQLCWFEQNEKWCSHTKKSTKVKLLT